MNYKIPQRIFGEFWYPKSMYSGDKIFPYATIIYSDIYKTVLI